MSATLAVLLAVALVLSGCSSPQSLHTPSPLTTPGPPPAPAMAPVPEPPSGPALVTPTPSQPAPPKPAPARVKLPSLHPQRTEDEEWRLRDQAARQIADADRAMRTVRVTALRPNEEETLGMVQSFLQQAQEALSAREYERATMLARKAKTLADDLPRVTH